MPDRPAETGSAWRTVGILAVVLFVAAVLPLPFGRRPAFGRVGPDKLLHLVGHGVFAASIAQALGAGRFDDREAGILAVGGSTGYGILVGSLQQWVPGRVHEAADVGAGFVGSVLGVLGWSTLSDTASSAHTDR